MALIQAHITKVEQEVGSEWGTIHTDHPQVKKLTTKRPELIREAAGFKTSGVLVGIDHSERSKTVQTDTGPRTYHDYYYNGGGALGNGASATDDGIDIVQPQPTAGRKTDPDDAWRMALTSGSERAVQTLPLMPAEQRDFETQKTIATAWAEFIFFTPKPTQSSRPLSSNRGYGYEPFGGGDPVGNIEQPPIDDDIPF